VSTTPYHRWDSFLEQVEGAFDQLVWDGRSTALSLLDLRALDPAAMSKSWFQVRAEVFLLVERVTQTWREQHEPAFEAHGLGGAALVEAAARGRRVGQKLLHELERVEIEVFAEAAEKLLAVGRASLAVNLRCRDCRASLPVPRAVFRASAVGCTRCSASTLFEPSAAMKKLEGFCAHHLSQREAMDAWEALTVAERRRREARSDDADAGLLREVEAASLRYWGAYFQARATLIPALPSDLERSIATQMRSIREELARRVGPLRLV
jgi:hypothetical protein